jgi:hypothetical protein
MWLLAQFRLLWGESFADSSAALLVVGFILLFLLALADDDDLPGPRRCFARADGRL